MKRFIVAATVALTTLIAIPSFAKPPTNFSQLIGVWRNLNPATKNIVAVIIRPSPSGITVQPFGACTPTPCNHGILPARTFSFGVVSHVARGFEATRNFGFKETSYDAIRHGPRLNLITQNTFALGDGRYDYTVIETFRRTSLFVGPEGESPAVVPEESQSSADHGSLSDLE